jgi:hypothetical protein
MDQAEIRERAEAHAKAVVEGDLVVASKDLTDEARAQAPDVMKELPRPVTGADVGEVRTEGDDFVVGILYKGQDSEKQVESRWVEAGGRPMISELRTAR